MELKGTNIAGMSTTRNRVEDDFYATPEETTMAILEKEELEGSILEPACGQGHISMVLKNYYPEYELVSCDLIQREDKFNLGIIGGVDFLTHNFKRTFDNIVTNPPFKFAQEFIEKALVVANKKVIMFAKIQLLEGAKRKSLFLNTPLKTVYVFSKRQNPLRNGEPLDEKGKPWSSTMCFAWFVWDKSYTGKPNIEWI